MFSNTFSGIKLEFDGLYYGGNYEKRLISGNPEGSNDF